MSGVLCADLFVFLAVRLHEGVLAILAQETRRHRHSTARVEDVHDRLAVVRRNLDGRMRLARGRATDEQRELEAQSLHLAGDVLHLVERGRDEAAQADEVGLLRHRAIENLLAWHHHAHVDDLVVITSQHDADDVLADVVHVALHGREHDFPLRLHGLAARRHLGLLGFHERREIRHGLLHHARGLHHLREKHFARAEQVADDAHARHERPFDDEQRLAQLGACLFGVLLNPRIDASHHRVCEAIFHGAFAPRFEDFDVRFLIRDRAAGFEFFAVVDESVRRVSAAIEQRVFDEFLQLRLNLLIHFEHAGVDDAHVHAGTNRVEEERAVHRFAHGVVAAKTERDVRHAAADFRVREVLFNPARGLDEVHGVVVVLLDARRDGEDVRVEDDVLRREADLVHENAIGAFADADFLREGRGLSVLVEGHHHDRCAILEDLTRVFAEEVLAALERDGVHDALALKTFQAGLDDFPLRGIHHERNLGNFGFAAEKLQEARHRGDAINHPFVHADVDEVGPVLDLLAGDGDGLVVFAILDQLRELGRAGDVRALADQHELADLLRERLRAGKAQRLRRNGRWSATGNTAESFGAGFLRREVARMTAVQRFRDRGNVFGRVAAAAASDVDQAALCELAEEISHVLGLQVEAGRRKWIRQARVRIARDGGTGFLRQFREEGTHQVGAERAVQSDGERFDMFHRVPQRLDGLRRNHRLAAAPDSGGDGDGQANLVRVEHLLNRHERGFCVQRIEDGFDEQEVRTARDEGAHLLHVSRLHLVERADAEARVVGVG